MKACRKPESNSFSGIHSEGSIIRTMIGLLFLDIIYILPQEDLLIDVLQTEPLDFNTDNFYLSRRCQIDERINHFDTEKVNLTLKFSSRIFLS